MHEKSVEIKGNLTLGSFAIPLTAAVALATLGYFTGRSPEPGEQTQYTYDYNAKNEEELRMLREERRKLLGDLGTSYARNPDY